MRNEPSFAIGYGGLEKDLSFVFTILILYLYMNYLLKTHSLGLLDLKKNNFY